MANHLIQWTLGDQELLGNITETVTCCSQECKEIALDLITFADRIHGARSARDVIASDQDANSTNADQDTRDLCNVVAHMKEEERNNDNHYDRKKVDQLRRQDGSVAICEYGKVVTLNIEKGQDDVLPSVLEYKTTPALEAITVEGETGIDDVE